MARHLHAIDAMAAVRKITSNYTCQDGHVDVFADRAAGAEHKCAVLHGED